MSTGWTDDELDQIDAAQELSITTRRPDGELRRWVPIWVVRVDDHVYVRTWHRRETGWFGHAVRDQRARVRLPGFEYDVLVDDLGAEAGARQDKINSAYARKYGSGGGSSVSGMVSPNAVEATLELVRAD